jgi:hypothetical protein
MKIAFHLFILSGLSGLSACSKELGVKGSVTASAPDGTKLSDPQPEILDFREGLKQGGGETKASPITVEQKSEASVRSYKSALDSLIVGLDPSEIQAIAAQIPRDSGPDLTAFELELNEKIKKIEMGFCDVNSNPKFETEILPIMTKYCIACHKGTFATIQGVGYALYQNFGKTSLAKTVVNSFNGTRMPPNYFPKPSTCIKAIVTKWAVDGGP